MTAIGEPSPRCDGPGRPSRPDPSDHAVRTANGASSEWVRSAGTDPAVARLNVGDSPYTTMVLPTSLVLRGAERLLPVC